MSSCYTDIFRLSGRRGDAAARNETRILMASPTLPQAIKRQIALRVTPCVPGETHKTIITLYRGRALVNGKAEERLGRGQRAATCHRYLVRPFDTVTWSVSRRLAAALLTGIKKKKKPKAASAPPQRDLAYNFHQGFPRAKGFNPHLLSHAKSFCFHKDM